FSYIEASIQMSSSKWCSSAAAISAMAIPPYASVPHEQEDDSPCQEAWSGAGPGVLQPPSHRRPGESAVSHDYVAAQDGVHDGAAQRRSHEGTVFAPALQELRRHRRGPPRVHDYEVGVQAHPDVAFAIGQAEPL